MGVEDHEYKTFKSLAQRTLIPALKEVNALSDLLVETEYNKDGKRIVAIKLYIHVRTHSNTKNALEEMPEEETETTLFNKLITINVNKNTANDFIKKYSTSEIHLTLEPVLFGNGKPLISEGQFETKLRLTRSEKLNGKGTLHLVYNVIR